MDRTKERVTMTLSQFFSTLRNTQIIASVYDSNGTTLLSQVNPVTYSSLDSTLLARTINKWEINVGSTIKVILNGAG